jgi:hypothetical protein
MRLSLAVLLTALSIRAAAAQPADCPTEATSGPMMPLALDLRGQPGVPSGTTGQGLVTVPMTPPGMACREVPHPSPDVLRGEPGDLLRGPGTPHVTIDIE